MPWWRLVSVFRKTPVNKPKGVFTYTGMFMKGLSKVKLKLRSLMPIAPMPPAPAHSNLFLGASTAHDDVDK